MKNFLKNNWFKLIIAFAIILSAISVFYYFVIFIPQKERARLEQQEKARQEEQEKELLKKELFDECMKKVEDNFRKEAVDLCFSLGYSQEEINDLKCVIPQSVENITKEQEKTRKEEQDLCFKKYPQ